MEQVDIFVAGVGTGGTVTGTGEYSERAEIRMLKIVAVEPASSPVLIRGQEWSTQDSGYRCRIRTGCIKHQSI